MRVPDDLIRCVTYLYVEKSGVREPGATAFFISVGEGNYTAYYAVTAAHCIQTARVRYGDQLYLRLSRYDGTAYDLHVPPDSWRESDRNDVAVTLIERGQLDSFGAMDSSSIDTEAFTREKFGHGDEICLIGLFRGLPGEPPQPITRFGMIAAMPKEPIQIKMPGNVWRRVPAFIAEALSFSGNSGSPVFGLWVARTAQDLPERLTPGEVVFLPRSFYAFVGLVHGHYNVEGDPVLSLEQGDAGGKSGGEHASLIIIIPGEAIADLLNEEDIVTERKKRAKERAPKEAVPIADDAMDTPALTKEGFDEALKRASRRVDSESDSGTKGT